MAGMSTEEELQFYQSILANPGNEGLLLIYADWLEEQGEPGWENKDTRAETIRKEVARHIPLHLLDKIISEGFATINSLQNCNLEQDIKKLGEKGCPGLVINLDGVNSDDSNGILQTLAAMPSLKYLKIRNCRIKNYSPLANSGVKTIIFESSGIDPWRISSLAKITSLAGIGFVECRFLNDVSYVEYAPWSKQSISRSGMFLGFKDSDIRHFEIRGSRGGNWDPEWKTDLLGITTYFPNLETLVLHELRFPSNMGDANWRPIRSLKNLGTLDLANARGPAAITEGAIMAFGQLPNLNNLHLNYCDLNMEGSTRSLWPKNTPGDPAFLQLVRLEATNLRDPKGSRMPLIPGNETIIGGYPKLSNVRYDKLVPPKNAHEIATDVRGVDGSFSINGISISSAPAPVPLVLFPEEEGRSSDPSLPERS